MKNYNTVKQYFETKLINHPTTDCKLSLNLGNVAITETYEDDLTLGLQEGPLGQNVIASVVGRLLPISSSTKRPIPHWQRLIRKMLF